MAKTLIRPSAYHLADRGSNMLELKALRIRQKSNAIYQTVVIAKDLVTNCKTDRWSKTHTDGYQRSLIEARVHKATKYLREEDGLFPTSVLLNVRGDLKFILTSENASAEWGTLTIPDDSLPFWVIDGQHRIESLREIISGDSIFRDYPMPVSIFNLSNPFDEMRLFYIVNSRQRSVPTDLALHHLHRTMTEKGRNAVLPFEPQQRVLAAQALDIVKILSTDPHSPWLGRVQAPNETKGPNHVIKERPLADSIGYILKDMTAAQVQNIQEHPQELAIPLIDYWNAIKELFSEAFAEPQQYTIQKTTGAYSLNMIYVRVAELCEPSKEKNRKDCMKELMGNMFLDLGKTMKMSIGPEFWDREHGYPLAMGTSMKLIKSLASLFLDHLRE